MRTDTVEALFHTFLKARFLLLSLLFLILAGGIGATLGLPVEAVPDISPQQVLVTSIAPGLATEEVEKLITFPVESSMAGLPGIKDLRSVSRSGVSVVYVQFEDSTDINLDRTRVSERMAQARAQLSVPNVTLNMGPLSTGLGEIFQFELKGRGYSLMDLNRILTWTVAPQIKLVPGVVDVNIGGGAEETWAVTLDPARLLAYGLSVGDVYKAVEGSNAASGGGWIEHHAEQQIVVGRGLLRTLDDFGAIAVKTNVGGTAIRLRDLGQISPQPRTRLGAVTRDGKGEVVTGVVMMERGASSGATLAALKAALPGILHSLPAGVTLEPFYSRASLTHRTIATVKENLVLGAALVVIVLLAVLGNLRVALLIASVIPFALLCAMTGMRLFGISANLLSLGAIDFGMIVDSSLVVVEHILSRRQREGHVPFADLVVSATRQVVRPVSFAILVIIMVYLPVLTLEDIEGHMFRPMAQTVIMALGASLLYCLVWVPLLSALVLARIHVPAETGIIRRMRVRYEPLLRRCMRRPRLVAGVMLGTCGVAAVLAWHLGSEFVPQLEEGALVVHTMRLPSLSLSATLESVQQEERILKSFPEVETIISNTGTAAIPTDPMGQNETDTFILLKEHFSGRSQSALVTAMNSRLQHDLPDALYSWTQPVQMRMDDLLSGVRTQIAVSIYGEDLHMLSQLSGQVVKAIQGVRGAADVMAGDDGSVPFVQILVNRENAARLNVREQDILDMVEAIGGHIGRPVTQGSAMIATQVRLASATTGSLDAIKALRLRRSDGKGAVLLSQVADITQKDGPPRISRDAIHRRMVVEANVRGRDLASFVAEAQATVKRAVPLPRGYTIEWNGQFRNLESASRRLAVVVPISLALIFILLVAALGSARLAALVFCNLPVAASGGIFALVLRGLPFSISAGIGFIALFGVAVLNGVVLISTAEAIRRRGVGPARAALTAAHERFRPVMATALVASLGFFPMAFSASAGAEVERPLASVVIGGLVSSTMLTLLVLPLLYARFGPAAEKTRAEEGYSVDTV
ncbi:cobalt transporter [Acetobacter senegalensis]|uniref:Cobalt transporter n=2 Tax=Acetobacter TaxID=434 RepID=A0A252EEH2_9PROT|nr:MULTISPECIES: CusA/CzcA family heavy metal efflux RND transporter [Acetobacter]ATJ90394.1 AcrB/AcrD/AcrF family protein [Acetobacter tropicalis]OUL64716.1 cobalt transporter [Acetobacter senegalensis]